MTFIPLPIKIKSHETLVIANSSVSANAKITPRLFEYYREVHLVVIASCGGSCGGSFGDSTALMRNPLLQITLSGAMNSTRQLITPFRIQSLNIETRRSLYKQHSRHRPRRLAAQSPNNLRHASSNTSPARSLPSLLYGTAFLLGSGLVYLYITDTRASIHRWLVVPVLRLLYGDAEDAHRAGNSALKFLWQFGLYPRERGDPDRAGDLQVEVFGYKLVNPIATSAGIDKDAEIPNALFAIGPSIVEVGGATPLPQDGNTKPRVFRVPSQNALINRYGLNSQGADHMAMILRHRVREFARAKKLGHDAEAEKYVLDGHANVPPGSLTPGRLLAVNIAKNKDTPDGDIDRVKQDYVYCVEQLGPYADILVVNVSSPNTPGLRSLQESKPLTNILAGVVDAAQRVDRSTKPAVMVKVSPDEDSEHQIAGICEAIWESGVDGVIVGNSTNRRPDLLPLGYKVSPAEERILLEQGGYSGPQLFQRTVSLVKKYRKLLNDRPQQARSSEVQRSAQGPARDSTLASTKASTKGPAENTNDSTKSTSESIESTSESAESTNDSAKADLFALDSSRSAGSSNSIDGVQASVSSEKIDFKDPSDVPPSQKQPLFRIPTEKYYHVSGPTGSEPSPLTKVLSSPTDLEPSKVTRPRSSPAELEPSDVTKVQSNKSEPEPPTTANVNVLSKAEEPKVIFATGGITNGKQALEVLTAGADVAMCYTALVYCGVGTISRIKNEMRTEMKKANMGRKQ